MNNARERVATAGRRGLEALERRLMLTTMYEYSAVTADVLDGYTLGDVLDYSDLGTVLVEADKAGAASLALWPNAGSGPRTLYPLDPIGLLGESPVLDGDDAVVATGQFKVTDPFYLSAQMGGIAVWTSDRWHGATVSQPAKPTRILVTDEGPPRPEVRTVGASGAAAVIRWTIDWTDYTRVVRSTLGPDDFKLIYKPTTSEEKSYNVSLFQLYDYVEPARDASKITAVYQATVELDPATGKPKPGLYELRIQKDKVLDIAGNAAFGSAWTGFLSSAGTWTAPPQITKQTDPQNGPELRAISAGVASAEDGPITNGNGLIAFGAFSTGGYGGVGKPAIVLADPQSPSMIVLAGLDHGGLADVRRATHILSDGSLLAAFLQEGYRVWRRFAPQAWRAGAAELTVTGGSPFLSEYQSPKIIALTADSQYLTFEAVIGTAPSFSLVTGLLRAGGQYVGRFDPAIAATLPSFLPGFEGDLSAVEDQYGAVTEGIEAGGNRSGVAISRVDVGGRLDDDIVSSSLPDFVIEEGTTLTTQGSAVLDGPVKDVGTPRIGPRDITVKGDAAPWRIAAHVTTETDKHWVVVAIPVAQRPVLFIPGIFGCFPTGKQFGAFVTTFGMNPEAFVLDPLLRTYDDLIATFAAHGYQSGVDLFPVGYDWRLPIAPPQEIAGGDPDRLGFNRQFDGVISNLTAADMTDGVYNLATDYLGYYLVKAARSFRDRTGRSLDSVDLFAHSTGGLVARAYIQSAAYGAYAGALGGTLPKVNIFTEIAVPNRGASKAWNITRNNWIADPAYQIFLSALADKAYDAVMEDGAVLRIPGPDTTPGSEDITRDRVTTLANTSPRYNGPLMSELEEMRRQAAFLDLYCPTARTLTATYRFLDYLGVGDEFEPPRATINEDIYLRNSLVLDLNDGLDRDYEPGGEFLLRRDPNRFAKLAHVRVVAGRWVRDGNAASTLSYASRQVGPRVIGIDHETGFERYGHDIYQMSSTPPRIPHPDEVWFTEYSDIGDGTVPYLSAQGQFGAWIAAVPVFTFETVADEQRPADHGGLNHNVDVMSLATRLIGKPADGAHVSQGAAAAVTWEFIKDLVKLWIDPAEAFIVDGLGRRLGWTAATGPLTEIPGSRYLGAADGIGLITGPVTGPLRLVVTGLGGDHLVQVTGVADGREIEPVVSSGFLAAGAQVTKPLFMGTADDFIGLFNDSTEKTGDRQGFVRGDWITAWLTDHLDGVAYGAGYWGGENYWFQDSRGDVWSLWHGGPVHADPAPEFAGQHDWLLTNLTDAAGLSGQLDLLPGSLSGIATGWNAFNIQGVADGRLWALWWSPGGSAGEYIDTDGTVKQGLALGLRGNGWVLSSISDAIQSPAPGGPLPGQLRGFTDSQGNGRTSFDPRPTRAVTNDGMSIIVVDTDDQVYAISFSVSQRPIAGAQPELNGLWVAEPIRLVPSIPEFGLELLMPAIEAEFIAAARV